MANLEYIKRLMPSNEGGVVNIEQTQLVFNNVHPLIYEVGGMAMNASGVITAAAVQAKLDAASSSTEPIMYIMNVSASTGGNMYPVKYTRHNDWYEFERNTLKRGDTENPRYRYNKVNFTFSPIDPLSAISMSLLKTPKDIDLGGGVTSELPAHTHKTVVELAVELASVAIREGDFTQLNAVQANR